MRLPDDMDEREGLSPTMLSALGAVCVFVLLIINTSSLYATQEQAMQEEYVAQSSLSPEDFDFWDMYPEATPAPVEEPTAMPEEEKDPSKDGKHTKIITDSGEEEWVLINNKIAKHSYDFTKLVSQSQLMKYYEDGEEISFVGVDISKTQEYVDFNKVQKAGIDFCMIRVGARGYGTGQLVLDDYFQENIKRATDAGLDIGVYFFSQAITEEEAIEEANLVLQQIAEYNITYPVAFQMEYIDNDTSRVEQLEKKEKTAVARAFLQTIEGAGYTAMLYGEKEWLVNKLELILLSDYDVWLSQHEDIPDYPYKFTMWQYTNQGTVDGISGKVNLNISFIDYSEK